MLSCMVGVSEKPKLALVKTIPDETLKKMVLSTVDICY